MGGFRFLLAFRFHRPRAGAGWAASASCWHSASTAPELALDGRLPLPAGMNGPSSPLGGLPVAQAQPWAPPLSQIPKNISKTYQSLQMGPRLEPRTTMWSNLPNHQHETMKEGIPSESQSDSTNASVFKTILPACTASASCWHFASTAPELALDGQLPLPAGIPLPLAFRFPRPRAGAGWAASASCWHER